jgi:phosphohistidine phosphatase SixA
MLLLLLAAVGATALALTFATDGSRKVDPSLSNQLRRGGLVLVLRHATTDRSEADGDPVNLDDCGTQRNLSAPGRAEARGIGREVRRLGISVGVVLTSPFCRTRETARLAFSGATMSRALLDMGAESDAGRRNQTLAVRRLLGTKPAAGTVTVLVTHGSVVADVTGTTIGEGESLVFRPHGDRRFDLIGRIDPDQWDELHAPAESTPDVPRAARGTSGG